MTADQPRGPAAVIVPAGQVKTVLAALDDAAGYKRDRAASAPTAPTSPAPPASGGFRPPMPTTRWPPDDPGRRGLRHVAARARSRGACQQGAARGR